MGSLLFPYFTDYRWENGSPTGIEKADIGSAPSVCYRIVSDTYQHRIVIEAYAEGSFSTVIYDSKLLDFRSLAAPAHPVWKKDLLKESDSEVVVLLRDENDIPVVIERNHFENGRILSCDMTTPQGTQISKQKFYYASSADPFNGLTLFDGNDRPVMQKNYAVDEHDTFTDLLNVNWCPA
jgi:hypothetical protein